MIGENHSIEIKVIANAGRIGSDRAVSLGLIVTELVLNAIKYAFPAPKISALILATYETEGADWKLTVSDNGVGKVAGEVQSPGLGTAIVDALVKQLDARMDVISGPSGTSVSITRATFTSRMPRAA